MGKMDLEGTWRQVSSRLLTAVTEKHLRIRSLGVRGALSARKQSLFCALINPENPTSRISDLSCLTEA